VDGTTDTTEELARFGNNSGTHELLVEQQGSSGYAIKSSLDLRLYADYDNDTSDSGSNIEMYTDGTQRMSITGSTGDISFYEDTGTTAKFFWDASAESLGIGTTSPSELLSIGDGAIDFQDDMTATFAGGTHPRIFRDSGGYLFLQPKTGIAVAVVDDGGNSIVKFDEATKDSIFYGDVGIGTNDPKTTLNLAANNSGQGAILTLENTDTSITTNDVIGQIDFYANDGSTNGTGAKLNIKGIATSTAGTITALTFGTADSSTNTATERMRIDGSGDVTVSTGNLVIGTSGKGIDFSAYGAGANIDSNLLDDYEEGTWTPDPSVGTASSASGTYTKIGNRVHIQGRLSGFSNTTNNEGQYIGGLPFSAAGDWTLGSAMWSHVNADNRYGTVYTSGGNLKFYNASHDGTWDYLRCIDMDSSTTGVYFSGTYKIA